MGICFGKLRSISFVLSCHADAGFTSLSVTVTVFGKDAFFHAVRLPLLPFKTRFKNLVWYLDLLVLLSIPFILNLLPYILSSSVYFTGEFTC